MFIIFPALRHLLIACWWWREIGYQGEDICYFLCEVLEKFWVFRSITIEFLEKQTIFTNILKYVL